jgi:hypothetical protein
MEKQATTKAKCRSFDCGAHDDAVSPFAQDDKFLGRHRDVFGRVIEATDSGSGYVFGLHGGGAADPEERLADGEGVLQLPVGGVWREGLPEVDVLGAAIGAAGEEQAGLPQR